MTNWLKIESMYTIRTRLAIVISTVVGLTSVFIYFYFPEKQKEQAIKVKAEKAKTIANMIAVSVGPALLTEDNDEIQNILLPMFLTKNWQ